MNIFAAMRDYASLFSKEVPDIADRKTNNYLYQLQGVFKEDFITDIAGEEVKTICVDDNNAKHYLVSYAIYVGYAKDGVEKGLKIVEKEVIPSDPEFSASYIFAALRIIDRMEEDKPSPSNDAEEGKILNIKNAAKAIKDETLDRLIKFDALSRDLDYIIDIIYNNTPARMNRLSLVTYDGYSQSPEVIIAKAILLFTSDSGKVMFKDHLHSDKEDLFDYFDKAVISHIRTDWARNSAYRSEEARNIFATQFQLKREIWNLCKDIAIKGNTSASDLENAYNSLFINGGIYKLRNQYPVIDKFVAIGYGPYSTDTISGPWKRLFGG